MRSPSRSVADVAYERVREVALRFPAAEEKLSHGAPSFHVRGKMFLTFVDDHHGDGRIAVWCKATLDDQRRLVAGNPARFFVPPYVGVKGWVGVKVDEAAADWIELAILVEDAWRSVAPPRVVRGEPVSSASPCGAAPARIQTDAKVAQRAFKRLSAICLALPEAVCEREGRHATFRVRGKVFAYFLDNHHGDGAIAACLKGDKRENARLVAQDLKHFYSPAYVGARGYLGVRLDAGDVDWKAIVMRVRAGYRSVAPKRLMAGAQDH
ncbi:MAG: MmcQ/YjbR family DNA-binding protein [Polyangiaceae bacterium]|jgi:hypothetical protein